MVGGHEPDDGDAAGIGPERPNGSLAAHATRTLHLGDTPWTCSRF